MAKTYVGVPANSEPKDVQAKYGFPEDCYVLEWVVSTSNKQAEDKRMMLIHYAGAPAALFNNAPLGAMLLNTTTYTWNLKIAAAGTGTWVASAAMS